MTDTQEPAAPHPMGRLHSVSETLAAFQAKMGDLSPEPGTLELVESFNWHAQAMVYKDEIHKLNRAITRKNRKIKSLTYKGTLAVKNWHRIKEELIVLRNSFTVSCETKEENPNAQNQTPEASRA